MFLSAPQLARADPASFTGMQREQESNQQPISELLPASTAASAPHQMSACSRQRAGGGHRGIVPSDNDIIAIFSFN